MVVARANRVRDSKGDDQHAYGSKRDLQSRRDDHPSRFQSDPGDQTNADTEVTNGRLAPPHEHGKDNQDGTDANEEN
jgi:hypothetical protein